MTIETNSLKGTIGEFSLADVVQLISLGGKSGKLTLFPGNADEGCLFFEYGYIVHAKQNGIEGETAAWSLTDIDSGTFEFSPGMASPEKTIMLSGPELLMRAAQRSDENAFLEDGGQLVLQIENSHNDNPERASEKIKDLLRARLGRRAARVLAALDPDGDSRADLSSACERIERYIALFMDEALAEKTGKEMRKILGQL